MKNRDPRLLLLLFSLFPLILWVGGSLVSWQFWNQTFGPLVGAVLVLSGFAIVKHRDRVIAWIYSSHLRAAIADTSPGNWIPVELEKTGTQDKLHVLPDSVGILQKTDEGLVLHELQGKKFHLVRGQILATNVSKTNMSCAILFTDRHNNDGIGYVVTPCCMGAPMEVAAYGNRRFEWFLQWSELPGSRPTLPN